MESGLDEEVHKITVRAMRSPRRSGNSPRKHYLSITEGPRELQDLLHEHSTFQKALREAREVLGAHGIDCIEVTNDPNYEGYSAVYGVVGRKSDLLW